MPEKYDYLIRGGLTITQGEIHRWDVAVRGEKITKIEPNIVGAAEREIDATGRYILPGIIDVHAHPVYLDNLQGTSMTAAHGGITTIIHYAYAKPGERLLEVIERFREDGEKGSVIDFALHGGMFDPKQQTEEIPAAVQAGVTSFKMFMTYAKLGWMTDDYQLMRAMDIISKVGGLAMVHAENG
ncbi:MAG: hypothetical protein U9Q23_05640, partial [Candidatus Bipolaricaulota bacterium]|nr:hypothetical protein [Candidatus Bipolaricaulota bacterium]